MPLPISVLQLTLVQLPVRLAWKLLDEIDRPWALVVSQPLPTEIDEFPLECVSPRIPGNRLHHSFDLLAHLVIRNAKDCTVKDPRMDGEDILDLLWVDVDPARDDH